MAVPNADCTSTAEDGLRSEHSPGSVLGPPLAPKVPRRPWWQQLSWASQSLDSTTGSLSVNFRKWRPQGVPWGRGVEFEGASQRGISSALSPLVLRRGLRPSPPGGCDDGDHVEDARDERLSHNEDTAILVDIHGDDPKLFGSGSIPLDLLELAFPPRLAQSALQRASTGGTPPIAGVFRSSPWPEQQDRCRARHGTGGNRHFARGPSGIQTIGDDVGLDGEQLRKLKGRHSGQQLRLKTLPRAKSKSNAKRQDAGAPDKHADKLSSGSDTDDDEAPGPLPSQASPRVTRRGFGPLGKQLSDEEVKAPAHTRSSIIGRKSLLRGSVDTEDSWASRRRKSSRIGYTNEFQFLVRLSRKYGISIPEVRKKRMEYKELVVAGPGGQAARRSLLNIEDKPLSRAAFEAMLRQKCHLQPGDKIPANIDIASLRNENEVSFEEFVIWSMRTAYVEDLLVAPEERHIRQVAREKGFLLPDVEKIRSVFERFDEDGSGCIDKEEFAHVLRTLSNVKEPGDISEARMNRFWSEVDTDKSGSVDFEEFFCWYLKFFSEHPAGGRVV